MEFLYFSTSPEWPARCPIGAGLRPARLPAFRGHSPASFACGGAGNPAFGRRAAGGQTARPAPRNTTAVPDCAPRPGPHPPSPARASCATPYPVLNVPVGRASGRPAYRPFAATARPAPPAVEQAIRLSAGGSRRADREARPTKHYRRAGPRAAAGSGVGDGVPAAAGTASAFTSPSVLRNSVSRFWRTSGLSLKNWRAFSRPWPIRSPL